MSKLAFFFVTLVAAIPAAYLGFLAVMGFLGHSGEMPLVLMGATGVSLLACAMVIAMPVAVLLRRGPREETPETNDGTEEEKFADEGSDDLAADGFDDEAVDEGDEPIEDDVDDLEYDDDDDFDAFDEDDDKTR